MSRNRLSKYAALFAVLALVAAACSKKTTPSVTPTGKTGGDIIIAAEQFPDCLNVVDTCASSSWLHWVAAELVLPKAMTLDPQGNFVPSPVLTGEAPTLANGGLKVEGTKFIVTFHIAPTAVWEDRTPITWEDFEFTRKAILQTTGTYGTLGYDSIESIKAGVDEREVIITFKQIYADWPDVFGGVSTNGYILKAAAFGGKPNLAGKMQDMIPFSGRPWLMKSYKADERIVFEQNPKFFGDKAIASRIIVIAREDQATEITALKRGDAFAAYPQPSDPGFTSGLGTDVKFQPGLGASYEGLWINMDKEPMNDPKVREAFGYAADRQSVVDRVIKVDVPDATVLNCAGWVPNVGDWCDNTDYAKYTYDPEKAKSLLTEAGWDCATTPCKKGGKTLDLTITTTVGNTGRRLAVEILTEKGKVAGFNIKPQFLKSPSPIFTDFLPKRQHQVAIFASSASPDPSVTSFLHSSQIPDAEGSGGQNWSGWKNADADKAMDDADKELDHDKRKALVNTVGDLEATDLPWIPMYQKPLFVLWRDDIIGGPIIDFVASSLSSFYNIDKWFLK